MYNYDKENSLENRIKELYLTLRNAYKNTDKKKVLMKKAKQEGITYTELLHRRAMEMELKSMETDIETELWIQKRFPYAYSKMQN